MGWPASSGSRRTSRSRGGRVDAHADFIGGRDWPRQRGGHGPGGGDRLARETNGGLLYLAAQRPGEGARPGSAGEGSDGARGTCGEGAPVIRLWRLFWDLLRGKCEAPSDSLIEQVARDQDAIEPRIKELERAAEF